MKKRLVVLVTLLGLCAGGYAYKTQGHYVSRPVENLPSFHALRVAGDVEVDFMQKPTQSVHVSGPQKVLDRAFVWVKEGVLEIGFLPGNTKNPSATLRLLVTAPELREVTVSGKGDVHVRGQAKGEDLLVVLEQNGDFSADGLTVRALDIHASDQSEADINRLDAQTVTAVADGQADIELAGLALEARLTNQGAGEIDAADLRAQKGKAVLSGRGDIKISAYEMLDASTLGKGKIKYKGTPVHLQRSGNLKRIIQDMDD